MPFDFGFFGSGIYKLPSQRNELEGIQEYIESLPDVDQPEIFGMHPNAEISL